MRTSHLLTALFTMMLCMPAQGYAQHRDVSQARAIAQHFWNAQAVRSADGSAQQAPTLTLHEQASSPSRYLFTRTATDGTTLPGFVLVSADECMPAVLGFSSNCSLPAGPLPDHVESWLRVYDEMTVLCQSSPQSKAAYEQAAIWPDGGEEVLPLLGEMQWDQDSPYNLLCPTDEEGKHAVTGCVATALAQIMRMHQWPIQGTGYKQYYCSSLKKNVSFDFDNVRFEWANMLDKYVDDYSEESATAVAQLMQAVGTAVSMEYGVNSSGTMSSEAVTGLREYLGYDADVYLAIPKDYTERQWHRLLQQELWQGRPVYYAGNGHAYVIDGVKVGEDELTYYHVNWGSSGKFYGYFLLHQLRPHGTGIGGSIPGTNYSVNPDMIVGISPDDGFVQPLSMVCRTLDIGTRNAGTYAGQTGYTRISGLGLIHTTENYNGSLRIEMHDTGNQQAPPIVIAEEESTTINLDMGLTNYILPYTIPEDVAPGLYAVSVNCTDTNGNAVDIATEVWPAVRINDAGSWQGGEQTQPLQYAALRGISIDPSEAHEGYFIVNIDTIANIVHENIIGNLAILVCDDNGTLIGPLKERSTLVMSTRQAKRALTIEALLPNDIPDGKYRLYIGFQPDTSSLWSFCPQVNYDDDILLGNFDPWYAGMTITDGNIFVGDRVYQGQDFPWYVETPAAIGQLRRTPATVSVYSLMGTRVCDLPTDRLHDGELPRGIYVAGGQKYVVK